MTDTTYDFQRIKDKIHIMHYGSVFNGYSTEEVDIFNSINNLIEEAVKAEKGCILKIIDAIWDLELCPYCSAPMKQSHYCEDCQDRVVSSCEGHGIAEYLKEAINKISAEDTRNNHSAETGVRIPSKPEGKPMVSNSGVSSSGQDTANAQKCKHCGHSIRVHRKDILGFCLTDGCSCSHTPDDINMFEAEEQEAGT